jgi:peptide/nickel transport system substrate-binding protein
MKNQSLKSVVLILVVVMLVIILLAGACTTPSATPTPTPTPATTAPVSSPSAPVPSTEPTPKKGGTLRILMSPTSANIGWPAEVVGASTNTIQCCLENLLRGDSKGNVFPWLAEYYKVADDLKSITFNLRKGVKFHDGSDFNAEVAKWNLDNYINAKLEPYWASVDIIDDYTIRVSITEWNSFILASFGDASTPPFMVSKTAFEKNGINWMKANPVGTGPFKFASFQQDVHLKFVSNPDYWVKGKPYLDGIEYIFVADAMTSKMAMETGEADIRLSVMIKDAESYKTLGFKMDMIPLDNVALVPDTANTDSPWSNQKVREAVEYAIDREAIAKAFGYGYSPAAYQIPTSSTLTYDPNYTLARKYDAEKAKQLLTEAGYSAGFQTTIIVGPMTDRNLATAVQAYLAKVGIKVKQEFPEMGKWVTYMGPTGKWSNAALFTGVPAGDVYGTGGIKFFYNMMGQSWQKTPEMLQAYQDAFSSPTLDIDKIRTIFNMWTKNALVIPVFQNMSGAAMKPDVFAKFFNRGESFYSNDEDFWLNR